MHQGDRDHVKGLYHVNLTHEVTQFQQVGAVAALFRFCRRCSSRLPFVVVGFNADNRSVYANHTVVATLNKLHVPNFTKSRARRSNDNALFEGKRQRGTQTVRPRPYPAAFRAQVNALRQGPADGVPELPPCPACSPPSSASDGAGEPYVSPCMRTPTSHRPLARALRQPCLR